MATAKRLPSGSWRVQVFSHYEMKDGKKVRKYKSFTSKDKTRAGKREAESMAAEWVLRRTESKSSHPIADAVEVYISSRNGLVSPSTLRAYKSYLKHHISDIGDMKVDDIDLPRVQTWVSGLSKELKPKTVKEIVSLLQSSIGKKLMLTTPLPSPKKQHTPTDAEIKDILERASEPMKLAILLASFCSLRRGEICALTDKDFQNGMVKVSKTVVRDVTGDWIVKSPKTPGSVRIVPVPDKIMELVPKGKIIPWTPDMLSKKFLKLTQNQFRFHDLRHYYASTAHYLGVPDAYIMANGGWKTDSVMKRVYREALEDKKKEENAKIAQHFEKFAT